MEHEIIDNVTLINMKKIASELQLMYNIRDLDSIKCKIIKQKKNNYILAKITFQTYLLDTFTDTYLNIKKTYLCNITLLDYLIFKKPKTFITLIHNQKLKFTPELIYLGLYQNWDEYKNYSLYPEFIFPIYKKILEMRTNNECNLFLNLCK